MPEQSSTVPNESSVSPQPIPISQPQNNTFWRKKTVIAISLVFLILLLLGGMYFYYLATQKKAISTKQISQKKADNKTTLNPNTGNLYKDIKIRLNQVME